MKPKTHGSIFNVQGGKLLPNARNARSNPLPYPSNLTPDPSPLRPHCAAKDRIRLWRPLSTRNSLDARGVPIPLSPQDLERIEGVSLNSLQPGTQATYGSGLLAFHVFCDQKGFSEELRAPVDELVLQSFIATLAGIYSATAITNYVSAVRAWHIIQGVGWKIGGPELDSIIKGAKAMAPRSSARAKREPITVDYITKLRPFFSDSTPLDVAVFACLTAAFWSTARLGEFTTKNLSAFDPEAHVKRSNLGESEDRNGLKTTTIFVPRTKSSPIEGESLYWGKQLGASDPDSAMQRHLDVNKPDQNFHLFGYSKKGKMVPLTKKTFLKRLADAAAIAGLLSLHGHSIRIGSTLEYLLRGVPFDVMKIKGRWSSDAFHKYLRDHAKVLAPYMQAAPAKIHDQFIRATIPSLRNRCE